MEETAGVIRFRMLQDDTRIQIDLYANLNVDRIMLGGTSLKYTREINAVFIDFPETLRSGREYSIDFHYSGTPVESGRFGGDLRVAHPGAPDLTDRETLA